MWPNRVTAFEGWAQPVVATRLRKSQKLPFTVTLSGFQLAVDDLNLPCLKGTGYTGRKPLREEFTVLLAHCV